MKIEVFTLGSFMVNCYLLTSRDGQEAILVDAPDEIEQVIAECNRRGLRPKMLVNTHGHFDHISGNAAVKAAWPDISLAVQKEDAPKLDSPMRNLGIVFGLMVKSPEADVQLEDGQKIALGDESLEVRHIAGHSAGGIALVCTKAAEGPPVALTGDTLMAGSVGRTDFPGCSTKALMTGIAEKLMTLPDETVCYPGHGPATTIGEERAGNPYLEEE